MEEEKFQNWLIRNENKKAGTANAYASAVAKISEHYSNNNHQLVNLYTIKNSNELSEIIALYDFKGQYFEIGEIGHGTYRNALKAFKRYLKGEPRNSLKKPRNGDILKTPLEKDKELFLFDFDPLFVSEANKMSEYYNLFYCLERSIRKMVATTLKDKYGDNWWNLKVGFEIKKRVDENLKYELETGFTERSDNKIDYTTFGDLRQIIKSNWSDFSNQFKSQRAFNNTMVALNILRVPIAHCTPFVEDEEIRLKLTIKDWFRLIKK